MVTQIKFQPDCRASCIEVLLSQIRYINGILHFTFTVSYKKSFAHVKDDHKFNFKKKFS